MTDEAILTEPAVPNKRRQPLAVIPHVYLAWVPANALNQNLQLLLIGETNRQGVGSVLCFNLKTVLPNRELIQRLYKGEFTMSENKTNNRKPNPRKPVKTFRVGAIAASVWKRQTSTGFEYLDFSLSRSWKLKSGEKEGYSTSFFHNNEDALLDVVEQAADFIRANSIPEDQARTEEAPATSNTQMAA